MSVGPDTLERIKTQLKEAQNTGHGVQQDLYSHLTEVFNKVIMNHPADAFDKFEEISALVKQTKLQFVDPRTNAQLHAKAKKEPKKEGYTKMDHVEATRTLINGGNDLVGKADQKLLTKNTVFTIPDFAEEADMLDWAGINFGQQDTVKLQHSIKRLAQMSGGDKFRFAGKIYGT